MADLSVQDVMNCPYCNSDDTYLYDTDEIEFEGNNTGHYIIDCRCNDCRKSFRRYIKFAYRVIEWQ